MCLCLVDIIVLKTPCGVPPPPPEFWLGVSWRLARFFDQQNLVRCVVVCFVFRQFLAGLDGSWLFLAVLGPLSSKTESQRAIKMKLGGAKRDPESMEMRSWVFQEASGAPGGSRSAKME